MKFHAENVKGLQIRILYQLHLILLLIYTGVRSLATLVKTDNKSYRVLCTVGTALFALLEPPATSLIFPPLQTKTSQTTKLTNIRLHDCP